MRGSPSRQWRGEERRGGGGRERLAVLPVRYYRIGHTVIE
jgi:hypothetical protein